jgi:hypothetical protein
VKTKCSTAVVCAAGTTACGYDTFIETSPHTARPTAPVTAATSCCKAAEFCVAAAVSRYPTAAGDNAVVTLRFACVADKVCPAGQAGCGRPPDGSGPLTKCCAANERCAANNSGEALQNDDCYLKPCAQQSATFCPAGKKCTDIALYTGKGPVVAHCEDA